MTAPRPDTPPANADRRLRHSLRQALEQAPDEDQQALQARLLALTVAGLLLVKPWVRPDAGMDELLQPDVLSLMTMGEL